MKSLSGYKDKIHCLRKEMEVLEREEFIALLFECSALRAEKLQEIQKIKEKIRKTEEDMLEYITELNGRREFPKVNYQYQTEPYQPIIMQDPFSVE